MYNHYIATTKGSKMSKLQFKIGDIAVITGASDRRTWIDEGTKVKVINVDKDDFTLPYYVQIVKADHLGETDWVHHTALKEFEKKKKKWKKVMTHEVKEAFDQKVGVEVRKRAVEEALSQEYCSHEGMLTYHNAHEWLFHSFVWDRTKEGFNFWVSLMCKLKPSST